MATKTSRVEIETSINDEGHILHQLNFANGHTRTLRYGPDHKLMAQFAAHGQRAKLLAAANSVDDSDKAVQKVDALTDAWKDAKWGLVGEGDGKPKVGVLAQAIAELKGISHEDAQKIVSGMTKAEQAKLRKTERVSLIVARLEGRSEGDDALDKLLAPAKVVVEGEAEGETEDASQR